MIKAVLLNAWMLLGAAQPIWEEPPVITKSSSTGQRDPDQLFTEANRLFNQARSEDELRRAVENYRALLERGIKNGHIYYNLGCAHLRMLEIGPAILNLRRGLRHIPHYQRAMATLNYARRQVPDEFPREGEKKALQVLFFWHFRTSFEIRLWVALITHAIFWGFLTVRIFFRLPFHRTLLGALLVVSLATGASAAVEKLYHPGQDAVIVLPEVIVRSGNGDGFEPVFANPVHSGVEVQILETRGNWKQLEFPNGVRGWVLGSAVESVNPDGK